MFVIVRQWIDRERAGAAPRVKIRFARDYDWSFDAHGFVVGHSITVGGNDGCML